METIIRIIVAVVAFVLIYKYLIPLLPAPFSTILLILVVVGAIIWLLKLV